MTNEAEITGIVLRTYVNENIGASAARMLTIENSITIGLWETFGYVCAPVRAYHIAPQVYDFHIDLTRNGKGIVAQYITVKFKFSGEWILIRQVSITQSKGFFCNLVIVMDGVHSVIMFI